MIYICWAVSVNIHCVGFAGRWRTEFEGTVVASRSAVKL